MRSSMTAPTSQALRTVAFNSGFVSSRPQFDHDMALAAYHLPLDGHLEVGNNALLAKGLGASAIEPFGRHGAATIGVAARFADPVPRDELLARTERLCGQAPLAFPFGPDPV